MDTQSKIDTAKVIGVAAGATSVTVADINAGLTTVAILISIAYTLWKWNKDVKKDGN